MLQQHPVCGRHCHIMCRSERTKHCIVSDASWKMLFDRIDALPTSVQHIVVVTTVPVLYPKVGTGSLPGSCSTALLGPRQASCRPTSAPLQNSCWRCMRPDDKSCVLLMQGLPAHRMPLRHALSSIHACHGCSSCGTL